MKKKRNTGYWLGKKRSPETCAKISAALIGHKQTSTKESRAKVSASLKGHSVSEATRTKISNSLKGRIPVWKGQPHTLEHRAKLVKARAGRKFPFNNTKPEKTLQNYLNMLNVEIVPQFQIFGIAHAFDFAIPEHKLLIEMDGCYWHACEIHHPNSEVGLKQQIRDRMTEKQVRELGWKVIRFWEHEIV